MRTKAAALLGAAIALAVIAWCWPSGAGVQRAARMGQPAPEITGGPWIGSEPLSLAGLRGRVVLAEFWTYG